MVALSAIALLLSFLAVVLGSANRQRLAELDDRLSRQLGRLQNAAARPQAPVPQRSAVITPVETDEDEVEVDAAALEVAPEPPTAAPATAPSAPPTAPTQMPAPTSPALVVEPAVAVADPTPAPEDATWEGRLAGRAFVWIGGVALVLAGAFLVKYSFDRGILSPGVRLVIGAIFGVGLIGAAQWLHGQSQRIAAAACGAGVADLFAVVLAATSVYHFLGPWTGLVLLGLVAAAAVALSLRHGAAVALLGLLGGFLTPALIGPAEMTGRGMLGYLLALEVGLLVVTRRRGWTGLAALTCIGAMGWAGYHALAITGLPTRLPLLGFLGISAVAFVLPTLRRTEATEGGALATLRLGFAACGAALAIGAMAVGRGGFAPVDFGAFALLSAAAVVLGRLEAGFDRLPWIAMPIATLLIATSILVNQTEPWLLRTAVAGYALIFAAGGYACAWRSRRPVSWASLSAVATVLGMLMAMWIDQGWPHWWAPVAGAAAVLVMAGAGVLTKREVSGYVGAASAMMLGAAVLGTLAVVLGLPPTRMAIGFAGLALAAAVGWTMLQLPALRFALGWMLGLVGVAIGLTWQTPVMRPGHWLVNGLWLTLGLPMALVGVLTAWLIRHRQRSWAETGAAATSLLALALGAALVRHGFQAGGVDPFAAPDVFEMTTYAAVLLGLACAGLGLARWVRLQALPVCAMSAMGVAAVVLLNGPLGWQNPLWAPIDIGPRLVLNPLLYFYGLPAVLAGWGAWLLHRRGIAAGRIAAATASLVLVFILVSLQIRHGFAGPRLDLGGVQQMEWYAYSLAWVIFALALLVGGWAIDRRGLRYAGLAVMALAVTKVFAIDTAHLQDLYRVLSLLGLGLALLGVALAYHRIAARQALRRRPAA